MKIIFMGTPSFALPSLRALIKSGHKVVAVVTQPDRPSGRGGKIKYSPVKEFALAEGIPVLQYQKISREGVEQLKALAPDIMVTAAYGQILSREVLDIAPHGVINVHGSLLPAYRGAAPVQWALINGEKSTGITIMQTEEGLDSGDIILQESIDMGGEECFDSLYSRLAELGARLLVRAISLIQSQAAVFIPQNPELATYFPTIKKTDGLLDFSLPARALFNRIRAIDCHTVLCGRQFKVRTAAVTEEDGSFAPPGTVLHADRKNGLVVACGSGALRLCSVQAACCACMPDISFLNGRKVEPGTVLGADA